MSGEENGRFPALGLGGLCSGDLGGDVHGEGWWETGSEPLSENVEPLSYTGFAFHSLNSILFVDLQWPCPLLLSTRSICNKVSLISDLIIDERTDLACITET